MNKKESGQVILVLLLIMTVVLAVGLSVVQRSLTDVSNSTKVEESSRAFSAAEAGLERSVSGGSNTISTSDLNNLSSANVTGTNDPPPNTAFEIQNVKQEDPANVWLSDITSASFPTGSYYGGSSLSVYWGEFDTTPSGQEPAIEISIISYSGGNYQIQKYFYDKLGATRTPQNYFKNPSTAPAELDCPPPSISTDLTPSPQTKRYICKATISPVPSVPVLLRARLVYTGGRDHSVAVAPAAGFSLPNQGTLYISTGFAGNTQRTIQLRKQPKVPPFFFDYVLFALGNITKQ